MGKHDQYVPCLRLCQQYSRWLCTNIVSLHAIRNDLKACSHESYKVMTLENPCVLIG